MKARSTRMRYYYFDFRRLLVNLFLRFYSVCKREHEERRADDEGDKEEDDIIVAESREQHKQ